MNCRREAAKMAVPRAAHALAPRAGQSRETAGLDPRRTLTVRRRVRHPRTPGFRLVEPTARREERPYPRSQQAIHEIYELGYSKNWTTSGLFSSFLLTLTEYRKIRISKHEARNKFQFSKYTYALDSAKISSPLGNYVTIRRTRHSGRAPLRGARSGIQ